MKKFESELTKRLTQPLPGKPAQLKLAPKSRRNSIPNSDTTLAAVLLLIYPDKNGQLSIVLMKRTEYPGHHSAQISFPGGKYEKADNNLSYTAMRESEEEIGVKYEDTTIIGSLTELYIPISNFLVHPYIAISHISPKFKPDPTEVDYLIELPLKTLLNTPISYTNLTSDALPETVPYFNISGETVWGATAMIMNEFFEIITSLKLNI